MDLDEEHIDIGSDQEEEPSTPWNDPMDDESRKLIEQMLAEEEYFYEKEETKKRKEPRNDTEYHIEPSKRAKKEGAISSAALPSHKTRWNSEEDARLIEALGKFGYGNWKSISEFVKSRNPLQCKNHARHLSQTDKVDPGIHKPEHITKAHVTEAEPSAHFIKAESVIIAEPSAHVIKAEPSAHVIKAEPSAHVIKAEPNAHVIKAEPNAHVIKAEPNAHVIKAEPNAHVIEAEPSIQGIIVDGSTQPKQPESLTSKDGNNIPTDPLFDPYQVSAEEIAHNPEWFRQKYSKTPDRYLKIRNHMLGCWSACKPKYLTKTSARKGLKDCGDVNAIGRVHQYLESVGAINFDCITHAPRPPKRVPREMYEEELDEFDASDFVVGYDGPRKRKVRNERGDWVDPRELEGRVIEHGQVVGQLDAKPKRVMKKSHQYYGGDDFGRGYDPFRLVPTSHYNDEVSAPFEVEIISDALLVMDFHSHLAHTEIIGLLGGNFTTRGDQKVLQVKSVFPCQSTSTGIQCEMDPSSEMKAREVFADKGFDVVGWYHSHPTFEPHPSIRDIENQTSYQTLFRKEDTGDEPFIGVIVTPYDPEMQSDHSQIQYLHISKEWNESQAFRVPYACRRTVIQSEQVSSDIFDQLAELISDYKDYEHKVKMLSPFSSQTRLEKLLDSLKAHLFIPQQHEEAFIQKVKDLVLRDFVTHDDHVTQTLNL